jgi:hypothetical protein
MHALDSAYIVTFALFLMVTLILLRIIHRNLTRPLFVLNAHMAGRQWYSLKKESNEIRYLRGYILSRLYEAKNLSDVYYEKWVEQDLKKAWP